MFQESFKNVRERLSGRNFWRISLGNPWNNITREGLIKSSFFLGKSIEKMEKIQKQAGNFLKESMEKFLKISQRNLGRHSKQCFEIFLKIF